MMDDLQFPKATPSTRDMLDRVKQDCSRELNCHLVCKVESFNKSKNTITASAATKRRYSNGTVVEFPVFSDVPVITLSGGDSFLSFPIKAGDWCLLLFNDRDIDSWWYSGAVTYPNSPRYHSLSDGIALVGLRPASDPLALVDDAVLLNAADKKINIKNDSKTIKAILEAMLDAIIGATGTITGTSQTGGAVTGTCAITADPNIATAKTLIAQLFKE